MKIKRALSIVFTLSLLLAGCVKDDLSDCGIRVRYQYVKNVDGVDRFATSVDKITLFVFNGDGHYIGTFTEEGEKLKDPSYRMPVNLMPGQYRLVAWGNLYEEYEHPGLTANETHINDLLLSLRAEGNRVEDFPTHLFFGEQTIEIIRDDIGRTDVLVDMMKNTNTIHVTIKGLPVESYYVDEAGEPTERMPFTCHISSVNRHHKFDNSLTGSDRLTYIPRQRISEAEQTLSPHFVTMRELNDGSTGSRLTILNTRSDETISNTLPDVLLDTELTQYLIAASVTKDLDIDDEYHLEIVFSYTNNTVTVLINDWVVTEEEWVVG